MFKKQNESSTVLACFSPPVMIATFVIEAGLALYALVRYRWNQITKLVVLMLIALSIFQLAEYSLCEELGLSSENWSRIGFIAITTLPPMGLHLINSIAGKPKHVTAWVAYATMAVWLVMFLSMDLLSGYGCSGNYVIFHLADGYNLFYGLYYYFWLLMAVALAINYSANIANIYQKRALVWGAAGYLSFILPTSAVMLIKPDASDGIPSIMCGFAVLFAISLVFGVLPNYKRSHK